MNESTETIKFIIKFVYSSLGVGGYTCEIDGQRFNVGTEDDLVPRDIELERGETQVLILSWRRGEFVDGPTSGLLSRHSIEFTFKDGETYFLSVKDENGAISPVVSKSNPTEDLNTDGVHTDESV